MAGLNNLQLQVFGRQTGDYTPNTYIGGIGGVLTTPEALATRLSIPANKIKNYTIDGSNNVSCHIRSEYTLPNSAFHNTTVHFPYDIVTYFIDLGGKCTQIQSFRQFIFQSHLDFVFFPNLSNMGNIGNETFRGCSNLTVAYFFGGAGFTFFGGSPENNNIFWGVTYNKLDVYIRDYFATNNGGLPDGDLTRFALKSVNYLSSASIPPSVQAKLNAIIL